jgi:hypothetical protein
MIAGWSRIYFVEHAAPIFRMETSRYFLPANLDGVGRTTAETDSRQSVPLCGGPGSVSGQLSVGFVVDELARGNVFLRVLRFSPVSIIPPMFHKSSIRHRGYQEASLVCHWRRSRKLAWHNA